MDLFFKKNEEVRDDFKAKGLDKAKEVLDYLKYSEKEKREYELYKESLHAQASMYESTYVVGKMEGKIEGKIEGIEEGKKAEKTAEKTAIAKKMLQKNSDIELIMELTNLTKHEIENLNNPS